MHGVLRPLEAAGTAMAGWDKRTLVGGTRDSRHHHRGAHERQPTPLGSVGSDGVAQCHGECPSGKTVEKNRGPWLRALQCEADCKESLRHRQPLGQCECITLFRTHQSNGLVSNITVTRRQNALALFQDYAERALAARATPKGLEQAFAATLQISPSMWSQIKASRPVGDKLARQIEALHKKPAGWLDETRAAQPAGAAELAFLELAASAWRATNSTGRRALRDHLKRVLVEAG